MSAVAKIDCAAHPIIFSGVMVRLILAGNKVQTRRIVKPQPPSVEDVKRRAGIGYHWFTDEHVPGRFRVAGPVWAARELGAPESLRCPYGMPGESLWVKETFAWSIKDPDSVAELGDPDNYDPVYRADQEHEGEWDRYEDGKCVGKTKPTWRPAIYLPRWASRLTLEIEDVRIERLQSISETEAIAEGIDGPERVQHAREPTYGPLIDRYANLWDEINGKRAPWSSNPWVWVITFRRVQ